MPVSTYGAGFYGAGLYPGKPFPAGPCPVGIELYLNGSWTDVTSDLGADGVTIVRGRQDEQGQPGPSSANLSLKNTGGKYCPRNPNSEYYGMIGRNTPIRIYVDYSGTRVYRFWGTVVNWPQKWTKKGAESLYTPIECAGVLRRLGQGASPLYSPLRRAIGTIGSDLVAYWPMEEGSEATEFFAAAGSFTLAVPSGTPSPAAYSDFPSSDPIPTIQDGRFTARVAAYTPSSPAEAQIRWVGFIPTGTTGSKTILRVKGSGTIGYVEVRTNGATAMEIEGFNDSGASVGFAVWGFGTIENRKYRFSLEMTQNGADIDVTLGVLQPGASVGIFQSGSFAGVTLGAITSVDVNPTGFAFGDVAFGHLTVEKNITSLFSVSSDTLNGYRGESASLRISRLCDENSLGFTGISLDTSSGMGPQRSEKLVDLMTQCADADHGILYEARDSDDLVYRTRRSMYRQTPQVAFAYTDNLLLPFEPVDDDSETRNKVTVTRVNGTSYTHEVEDDALGTATVGIYDDERTLNLGYDSQVKPHATWLAFVGTIDESRWPVIGLDLAHPTFLADAGLRDAILNIDLGDRVTVDDLPEWLPPFPVSAIVQGYTEYILPNNHKFEFNCTPGQVLDQIGEWDNTDTRWSAVGTTLATDVTTTGTSLTVTPPSGILWTDEDGDYDIVMGGELMTVTAVTGTGPNQTMTVTRSVNGVVKTHSAGSAISLASPARYGL